jgi:replication factor A1
MASRGEEGALEPVEVRLRDLRPTQRPTIIVARVVSAERRDVTLRSDGSRRPVLSGLLSDGTATVRFTWWDPPAEPIERGMVLRAGPVQVREFRGRAEVSFGWKTRVVPAHESDLPEVRLDEMPAPTIAGIRDGDDAFRVDVRVARVAPKTVSVGEDRRLIHEGTFLDSTGEIAFTAWTDFHLRVGEGLRVLGASAKESRGRPQVVLDERTRVERRESADLPSLESWSAPRAVTIAEIEHTKGAERAVLEGLVLAVLPPSGLVSRCPQCRRSVVEGRCREHGTVTGEADLRGRWVLDDGTGCATIHTDRLLTERLSGTTLEACVRASAVGPSLSEDDLLDALFGRRFTVVGRARHDAFGLTVDAETMEEAPGDVPEDLAEWRRVLEGRA